MSCMLFIYWRIAASNECQGISIDLPLEYLLKQSVQAGIKRNIQARYHWQLCREPTGDIWIPHHTRPVMQKVFSCNDVMICGALVTAITWNHEYVSNWCHQIWMQWRLILLHCTIHQLHNYTGSCHLGYSFRIYRWHKMIRYLPQNNVKCIIVF